MPARILSFNLPADRQAAVTQAVKAAYDTLFDQLAVADQVDIKELIIAGVLFGDLHGKMVTDLLNEQAEQALDAKGKAKAFKQQRPNTTQG